MNMNKFMKTIAYVIPVTALFVIAIFAMPTPAHAWYEEGDSGDPYYYGSSYFGGFDFGDINVEDIFSSVF